MHLGPGSSRKVQPKRSFRRLGAPRWHQSGRSPPPRTPRRAHRRHRDWAKAPTAIPPDTADAELVALRLRGKSPASAPTATTTSRRSGGSPRGTYLSDLQRYADSLRGAAATRGRRLKTLKSLLPFATGRVPAVQRRRGHPRTSARSETCRTTRQAGTRDRLDSPSAFTAIEI